MPQSSGLEAPRNKITLTRCTIQHSVRTTANNAAHVLPLARLTTSSQRSRCEFVSRVQS
jgi:hypothetical protein